VLDFQVSGTGNVEYDYASGRIHPDYNEENVSNDIAIFELSQLVPSSVTPVKLRQTPLPSTTQSLTVIGFGDTDPLESVSETSTYLREVDLNYVSAGQCSHSFGGSWWGGGIGISDGMLCAYNPGKDSCGGDSGGPLLLKGSSSSSSSSDDDDELVGLVSWGISCADDEYPGVYTRISYYYDWIIETMCDLNSNPSGLPEGVVCESSSSSSSSSSNTGGSVGVGVGVGGSSGSSGSTSSSYYDDDDDDDNDDIINTFSKHKHHPDIFSHYEFLTNHSTRTLQKVYSFSCVNNSVLHATQ